LSETSPGFSNLGLSPKVLEAIAASGYTTPTPIQAQAIPDAVAGKDILGIAQTGTGKTASYVLPMLTRLEQGRARARMPRSLILCPTRELAAQVAENFEKYGSQHKLNMALLIGGVSFDEQNRKLDRGVDVLIATPGRLLDQYQRGKILMTGVDILVIDEADRMLDMGFIPDIERICSLLPPKKQTLFFSATMPPEIQRLVDRFLKSPTRVEVAKQATTASTITQRFQFVEGGDWEKREALRGLIRGQEVKNAIIFCNRKRDVDVLHKSLIKHGFNAGCLHGDMEQHTRTATLDGFRSGAITLLAASDVAARGLDIPDVSHVFNFDVPIHSEDYVHRIGRTGRAGKLGASFTLVTDHDIRALREIEKMTGTPAEWMGDPPPEDAGSKTRLRGARRGAGGTTERRGPPARGGRTREPRRRDRDEHGPLEAQAETPIAAMDTDPGNTIAAEVAVAEQQAPQGDSAETRNRERPAGSRTRSRRGGRGRDGRSGEERTTASEATPEQTRSERPPREHAPREQAPRDPAGRERGAREHRPREQGAREPRRERPAPPPREEPGFGQPSLDNRAERPGRPQRAERTERPHRRERDDGPPVVGLGDHMPDFLKRPVK
jgi:superfamily II DNA/RNA helicase